MAQLASISLHEQFVCPGGRSHSLYSMPLCVTDPGDDMSGNDTLGPKQILPAKDQGLIHLLADHLHEPCCKSIHQSSLQASVDQTASPVTSRLPASSSFQTLRNINFIILLRKQTQLRQRRRIIHVSRHAEQFTICNSHGHSTESHFLTLRLNCLSAPLRLSITQTSLLLSSLELLFHDIDLVLRRLCLIGS